MTQINGEFLLTIRMANDQLTNLAAQVLVTKLKKEACILTRVIMA